MYLVDKYTHPASDIPKSELPEYKFIPNPLERYAGYRNAVDLRDLGSIDDSEQTSYQDKFEKYFAKIRKEEFLNDYGFQHPAHVKKLYSGDYDSRKEEKQLIDNLPRSHIHFGQGMIDYSVLDVRNSIRNVPMHKYNPFLYSVRSLSLPARMKARRKINRKVLKGAGLIDKFASTALSKLGQKGASALMRIFGKKAKDLAIKVGAKSAENITKKIIKKAIKTQEKVTDHLETKFDKALDDKLGSNTPATVQNTVSKKSVSQEREVTPQELLNPNSEMSGRGLKRKTKKKGRVINKKVKSLLNLWGV